MAYPKNSARDCLEAGLIRAVGIHWVTAGLVALLAALLVPVARAQQPAPSPFIEKLPPVTEDEAITEPDYAEVAADARKIADEIEQRLIERHMEEAAGGLSNQNAPLGYAKAEEAHADMKEMIKFCDSAGGGAGSACKFKLEIQMGMSAGNTLGQLKAGMKPGSSGLSGLNGQGSSGQTGGGQNFGVFGPESFGDRSNAKSRMLGDKKAKSDAAEEGPGSLSNNVDEVAAAKKTDASFDASGGPRVLEEYRGQIDGYFKKLAEEEAGP